MFEAFKNFAVVFSGRARRKEYWLWSLFVSIVSVVYIVSVLCFMGSAGAISVCVILYSLFSLVAYVPSLAVLCRRLHDTGRSGWSYLWCLTVIGAIWVLIWLCKDSAPGENKYGPNPKEINGQN